ncbi:hypothetical protein BCR34DRAFT_609293 [Clohesyomyces aquaticus]|uniref:Uncharacterized protein n=1 Tax=Clohesyomyces aquaticus TaxID=1231657 RepID=A0A1Y1XTM4_9PLEO|nr:hypothetical protein BCR34DRAFT_609293 [Clohesyomyces aquaticus]
MNAFTDSVSTLGSYSPTHASHFHTTTAKAQYDMTAGAAPVQAPQPFPTLYTDGGINVVASEINYLLAIPLPTLFTTKDIPTTFVTVTTTANLPNKPVSSQHDSLTWQEKNCWKFVAGLATLCFVLLLLLFFSLRDHYKNGQLRRVYNIRRVYQKMSPSGARGNSPVSVNASGVHILGGDNPGQYDQSASQPRYYLQDPAMSQVDLAQDGRPQPAGDEIQPIPQQGHVRGRLPPAAGENSQAMSQLGRPRGGRFREEVDDDDIQPTPPEVGLALGYPEADGNSSQPKFQVGRAPAEFPEATGERVQSIDEAGEPPGADDEATRAGRQEDAAKAGTSRPLAARHRRNPLSTALDPTSLAKKLELHLVALTSNQK